MDLPASVKTDLPGGRERIMARRLFVFKKRREGLTHEQITEEWNRQCLEEGRPEECKKRSTIVRDIKNVLTDMRNETDTYAREERDLLVSRLEYTISREKFVKGIEDGNLAYIDRLIKVTQSIAQLTGANAPTKVAATDTQGNDVPLLGDEERAVRIKAILEKAQARRDEAEDEENFDDE